MNETALGDVAANAVSPGKRWDVSWRPAKTSGSPRNAEEVENPFVPFVLLSGSPYQMTPSKAPLPVGVAKLSGCPGERATQ